MSKSVDERIVQMRFDNKEFENGIKASTKSLDNLKKGLQLDESAKSLSNLDKVGKSFSLAGISSGVETIASRFTTLGIVGVTALVNISNSAIDAGKTLISSLTIDPIKMGYEEYETKMNAIQTILTNTSSKGTKLKDVTEALDELNTYSDKTIYNFSEMTKNIGTFTAAGVDLETSTRAIQGIANLAAGSGSSALQASTAMYQLSQAIAAGKVGLQDWNSVVNAGMGGELFKNALLDMAKGMHTVKTEMVDGQEMIVSYTKKGKKQLKTFRDSLKDGWLTSKVLVGTLEKFANDESLLKAATQVKTLTQLLNTMKESVQSGWAKSWELIVGDKDQAAEVFTGINDVFSKMAGNAADTRNAMLEVWNMKGGRAYAIEAVTNAFNALMDILKPIKEAFREVFPAMTGERLIEITKNIRDLTSEFKIGDTTAANIKATFKGLFSVLDIGLKAVKLIVTGIGALIKALTPELPDAILAVTGYIGSFLTSINDSVDANAIATTSLETLGSIFGWIGEVIGKVSEDISPYLTNVKEILTSLGGAIKEFFTGTTVMASSMTTSNEAFAEATTVSFDFKTALDKLHEIFEKIGNTVGKVATAIKNVLTPVIKFIKEKIDELSLENIGAVLTGSGLLMLARALSKGIGSVSDIITSISGVFDKLGDTLKAFQLKVKAEALVKVAVALAILAGAIFLLSRIKIEELAVALGALTLVFAELVIGLKILEKSTSTMSIFKKQSKMQLIGLGVAILLLATAVKTLSSLDPDKLKQGVTAIAEIMGMLVVFINMTKSGDLATSAGGLVAFSLGITILAGALAIFGNLKPEVLKQGTEAIVALMGAIMLFINLTRGGDLKASAAGLMGFATGIAILAGALAIFGNLKPEVLKQGGEALASLMSVIAMFVLVTKGGDLKASGGGLMGFATGIAILCGSLAILGKMKPEVLEQGAKAIITLMGSIGVFVMMTRGGDLKQSSAGMMGFAVGLALLSGALALLGNMDPASLGQGAEAIITLMKAIALFIIVTRGGDLKSSSAGLIGFAVGLTVLTAAVAILALINPDKIIQGVGALVVLMTAIALFIKLTKEGDLKKSADGLIKFAAGLAVLAGVIAILSALNPEKLLMASTAVSALMLSIAVFIKVTKEGDLAKSALGLIAFSAGIAALSYSLISLGQLNYEQIIAGGAAISILLLAIVGFVKLTKGADLVVTGGALVVFSGALFVLTQALVAIGSVDVMTLITGIGALAAVFVIIGVTSAVLTPLAPAILALSAAVLIFGAGCLAVGAGMQLFAEGLDKLVISGAAGSAALVIVVENLISLIPSALKSLALGIIGFVKTLGDNAPVVAAAFMKIVNAILDTAVKSVPKMVDSGLKLVLGILKGIADNIQKVVEAGISIIVNFIKGVTNKLPDIVSTALKLIITFINSLADAIRNNAPALNAAISNLMNAIIRAIVGFIPTLVGIGKDVILGLIDGIKAMGTSLWSAMKDIVSSAVESVKDLLGIHSPSTVFDGMGVNMMQGMINGIKSMASRLWRAAKDTVSDAVSKVKDVLGIHSPSRVFAEIGKFSVMGLAGGLDKFSYMASNEAENVGSNAMNALRNTMSKMSDVLNSNADMNPTIRPVLDLTNIQNGSKQIGNMMNKYNGYSISGTVDKANFTANNMRAKQIPTDVSISATKDGITTQRPGMTQHNTFHITGANPKEIANEVARIIQTQVERSEKAWA